MNINEINNKIGSGMSTGMSTGINNERGSSIIDESLNNPKTNSHVTKNKGKWNKNHIIKTFLEGNKMSRILLFLFMYYCIFKVQANLIIMIKSITSFN